MLKSKLFISGAILFMMPTLFSCNPNETKKNSLTYSGGTEFVIMEDTVSLSMNLNNKLSDGDYFLEPTFGGFSSENASLKSANIETKDKTVTVTLKFADFRNESYYNLEKMTVTLVDKNKATICSCVVNNLKVSWPGYGEPTIKTFGGKVSQNTNPVVVGFACSNEIDWSKNNVGVMAAIQGTPSPATLVLEKSTAEKVGEETKGKDINVNLYYKNDTCQTGSNTAEIDILVYVYNNYNIVTNYGVKYQLKVTYTKLS